LPNGLPAVTCRPHANASIAGKVGWFHRSPDIASSTDDERNWPNRPHQRRGCGLTDNLLGVVSLRDALPAGNVIGPYRFIAS
jgi:hypothetical protein